MIITDVKDEFEEAVGIRQELNGVLWKRYTNLSNVFSFLFGTDYSTLKRIADLNYYQGGYPNENSPAKIADLVQRFGTAIRFFYEVNRLQEFNDLLEPFGFQIAKVNAKKFPKLSVCDITGDDVEKKYKKAYDAMLKEYPGFNPLGTPEEIITWFLDTTFDLQKEICGKADLIKIDLFGQVEDKLEKVDKGGFVTAVNRTAAKRTKIAKAKSVAGVVEAAAEHADKLRANAGFLDEAMVIE